MVAARWPSKYTERRLRRNSAVSLGSYSLIGSKLLILRTLLMDNARFNPCRCGFAGVAGGIRSLVALRILPAMLYEDRFFGTANNYAR